MSFAITASIGGALIGADASGDAADTQAAASDRATAAQKAMFDKQVELQKPFRDAGLTANNQLMYLLGLNPDGQAAGDPSQKTYAQLRQELAGQFTKSGRLELSPFGSKKTVTSIDENGLAAEIDKRLAAQGPSQFGSLMRDFSMDDFEADPGYQFRMDEGTRAVQGGAAARGGLLSGAAQKALLKYGQGAASEEYGNAFNRFTGQQTNKYNRLAGIVNTGQGATNQVGNAAQQFGNSQASNIIGAGNAAAAGQIGQANALVGGINQGFNTYQNNQLLRQIQNPGAGSNWGSLNNQYFSGNFGMAD